MTNVVQMVILCVLFFSISVTGVAAQSFSDQPAPLPSMAAPSYHPGLFGQGPDPAQPPVLPPVVNTFERTQDEFAYIPPSVNISYFAGNPQTGEPASVAGFVAGSFQDIAVNISGRSYQSEPYIYLVTVRPNEQGIFVWQIPDWALPYSDLVAEIAQ